MLFRNELVAANGAADKTRAARPGEVRRIGKHAQIVAIGAPDDPRIAIAIAENADKALGPSADATLGHGMVK